MRSTTVRRDQPGMTSREQMDLLEVIRDLTKEAGAATPLLLALVKRRQPDVTPLECARFILAEWRRDDAARARLLSSAAKSDERVAAEREIAEAVQTSVARHAGGHAPKAIAPIRKDLVAFLRARLPQAPIANLKRCALAAVELREERLVILLEPMFALLLPAPALAS